ncbi:hypothetical protein AX14_004590 [Amanita brunnescens Koide BX004]|nr:hypothetical protein AX14_004590 [Amanita brunnescens Koide BX004]
MASSDGSSSITITSDRAYMSDTLTKYAFAVVQAENLTFPANSRRQCIVEIVTGDIRRLTESVKSEKDRIAR